MSDFNIALPITLRYEGGYANNKADSGGETYRGVARNYNKTWQGWAIIDAYKAVHGTNGIDAGLSTDAHLQELVKAFYLANYWNVNRLSELKDQQVANVLFDVGVNMGVGRAAEFLQTAVHVNVDRIIGAKTIAAANACNQPSLFSDIQNLRRAKYESIIAHDPTQAQFKSSWFSRLTEYKTV